MAALKLAYALGLVKLIDLEPNVPDTVRELTDIEYRSVGGTSLALDVYRPADLVGSAPVLVFIHGGSWKSGNRRDYLPYLIDFAERGYVTVTVSYRFMQEAVFPAAVSDITCALEWIGAHATEYQMDPNRVALIGGSAGGHLAMMAAYSGVEFAECGSGPGVTIRAVVNLYGPSDLTTDFAIHHPTVEGFLGTTYDEDPEAFVRASPVTYITTDDPPTLIFHGTLDETVPVSQSDLLAKRLGDAGVITRYHRLNGWPHTMDAAVVVNEYCEYYMADFFRRYVAE